MTRQTVSGHTHGGQCRVPLLGYAPVTVRYGRKYIYGDFEHSSGGRLFVTRGLGTTGLRVRFACEPEIAVLTLRANQHSRFTAQGTAGDGERNVGCIAPS